MRWGPWLGLAVAAVGAAAPVANGQARTEAPLLESATGDLRDWRTYYEYGIRQFARDPRQAEAAFDWARRLEPSRPEVMYAQSVSLMMRLSNEEFLDYMRGDTLIARLPHIRESARLFNLAIARNPFIHHALEIQLIERFPMIRYEGRLARVWVDYSNGDFDRALAGIDRGLAQQVADSTLLRAMRILVLVHLDRLPDALVDLAAIETLARSVKRRTAFGAFARSTAELHYLKGRVFHELGQPEDARASFEESLAANPDFAYAHLGVGTALRALGKPDEAIAAHARAVAASPEDGYLRYLHAQVLAEAQRLGEAALELDEAIRLEPQWPLPLYLRGLVSQAQGKQEMADRDLRAFADRMPAADPQAVAVRTRLEARAKRAP